MKIKKSLHGKKKLFTVSQQIYVNKNKGEFDFSIHLPYFENHESV
jgi:hypothetical protein